MANISLKDLRRRIEVSVCGYGSYRVILWRGYRSYRVISHNSEAYDRIHYDDVPERAHGSGGYTLREAYLYFYHLVLDANHLR